MPNEAGAMGTISYLIVQFPGNKMTGEGSDPRRSRRSRRSGSDTDPRSCVGDTGQGWLHANGRAEGHVDRDGRMDPAAFEGASSGLLDDSDLADAASVIDPPPCPPQPSLLAHAVRASKLPGWIAVHALNVSDQMSEGISLGCGIRLVRHTDRTLSRA